MLSSPPPPPVLSLQTKSWVKLAMAIGASILMLIAAHLWNLSLSSGEFGNLADGKITVLRSALVKTGEGEDGEWKTVTLPDRVDNHTHGHVQYRLTLPVNADISANNTLALCVPRWSSNATVWLGGHKLLDLNNSQLAVQALHRAAYLTLPPGLPPGQHPLHIRLKAIPGTFPGLSEVWFGDSQQINQACGTLQDVNMGARIGALYLMVFLALMSTGIAVYKRDELALGFAAVCFFWSLHSLVLLDWLPFIQDSSWLAWMHITRFLPTFATVAVALRLSHAWNRYYKWSLLSVFALAYGVFPLLPVELWNRWLVILAACLGPFIAIACVKLVLQSARSTYYSDFSFSVAMLFGIGVNIMDMARNRGWLPYSAMSLTYLVVPVVSLAIGFLVLERLQEYMRQQAQAGRLLAQKLQEQKIELASSHKLLQEQRETILLNEERQRMVQDMHDGLGSQLVSASALLKSGANLPAQSRELNALIDNALLDLRSLLDVFSSTAQRQSGEDDTVSLLLSMLRHRLTPVFRSQGIALEWDGQPLPPQFLPDDRQRLQLLRLLQEACANIIKHACATSVTLRTQVLDDAIEIEVRDNGQGMQAASIHDGRRTKHGISNMQIRAQKLGAKLVIESTPAGTCVRLIFPSTVHSTAQA